MLKNEWKHLVKNKLMLVVVIAVITIPTIYTTLFLGSMWDPYGNVDKLPVAVVNNDKAVEYEGETLNVGQELVDQLADDGSLDFRFVDADDAEQGLDDGTYYMVITIPENFSANASSLTSDAPEKMVLDYETNPGTNYIASKMSETAMKTIEASVRESVTKTYVQAVYDQIVVIGDGMQDAADGTGELQDGAVQLKDGNTTMTDGLQTLADSTLTFVNGSEELTEGLASYVDGVSTVNSGAQTLDEGAQSAKDGSAALVSGTQQVDDNMTTLNAGLTQLYSATVTLPQSTTALDTGVGSVQSGISQLQDGNEQLQTGVQQLSGGAQQLDAGLATIVGKDNENSVALRTGAAGVEQGIDTMVGTVTGMLKDANTMVDENVKEVKGYASAVDAGLTAPTDVTTSLTNASAVLEKAENDENYTLTSDDIAVLQKALADAQTVASDNADNYKAGKTAVGVINGIATKLEDSKSAFALDDTTQQSIAALEQGASDLTAGVKNYTNGVDQAAAGTSALVSGASQLSDGLTRSGAGLDQLADGTAQVKAGTEQLAASAPALTTGIAQAQQGGAALQSQGTSALVSGASQLYSGLTQLATGTTTLADGTKTLVSNNATLMSGANQLTDGAVQIADGSDQLLSGSKELGDGLDELYDGTDTLKSSLSDAADEVKATNTSDSAVDLFSAPVDTTEEQMTTVENNGHAMAPYMMSVALWVGCIAFSLMYPLTEYYGGKLKSGVSWWLSKASVLYLIAILQALCMLFCLHVFDGFNPARWGLTIAVAIAASLAFMSIMYFFTNFIGKAGSFLMLVFMVVQLAGSVGTYPLELSGGFVKYLHDWVPFTYTVKAFRSTIAGGESVESCILFMLILFVVFSILSIMVFQGRARKIKAGKPTLHDWLDAHHLA